MAIFLIRHGETPGNRDRIIQFPDTPLSDRGREQAARLGDRMKAEPIREIWVSDHARAHQTARAVEQSTGAALSVVEDLAERNLGALRGRPYAELDFDPFAPGYVPPEGESWDVFHARVDAVWARIEEHWRAEYAAADDHFCIVTHGLVLRSLFERRLLGADGLVSHANADGQVAIANTAVSILAPRPGEGDGLAHSIELLACTAHLDETTAPRANPNVGM
ncbi:MAG: histidine phosphatase family protein [Myxococcota bacterium]